MEAKYEMKDEDEMESEPGGLVTGVKNLILLPIRPFISKTALRTYLTSILIISTSTLLLIFAITAYILFYYAYVPNLTFSRTIHLQFDAVHTNQIVNRHPYGTATLAPDLITGQAYDVAIELSLPRTPDNIAAGNFMLQVDMLAAAGGKSTWGNPAPEGLTSDENTYTAPTNPSASASPRHAKTKPLATSRRPAILPYRSWPVETLYKLTELHWYLLNFRSESETLHVPMFEDISFPASSRRRAGGKEWASLPDTLRVEVQSSHRLQIYSARAVFRARFAGIRWFMFSHRLLAAGVFIVGFWVTEMVFAGVVWAAVAVSVYPRLSGERIGEEVGMKRVDGVSGPGDHEEEEEEEHDGKVPARLLSDTERTFPTLGGKKPLRYSSPRIKREEEDGETEVLLPADGTAAPLLADDEEDEDEEDGVDMESFVDSGFGTSLESAADARRESIRRRRGRASLKVEEEEGKGGWYG
ncbi:hypothetical protein KC332_g15939 [Hortaea werneckii]|uniref:Seipin n=1 Tax=Hortaea werneckii TaxID=91943 RepID=A0A3M7IA02_HORWE|nr:hypothetical protein KC350_g16413 [Hortaea werneckii]KAI6798836.1 hypothetical protein KC358_g16055 [Hortaea werneckii]KAI6902393.1 hypothetical protein KC348_g16113 [Hortaea werneckii]KAI6921600.1 hypothetical protein KC341_g15836 [Hortaea werneckii]KAI6955025.1 hypothetical protein KC321_g16009 [Hortaea werneckii]